MKLKAWKKVTAVLLAFAMIFGICEAFAVKQNVLAAEKVSFTVDASTKQLYRGDTVTYTVSMAQNEAAIGLELTFKYDNSVLELQETAKGGVFDKVDESWDFGDLMSDEEAGCIKATIAHVDALKNGTVFTATFKVTDSAKGEVNAGISAVEMSDDSFANVDYTVIDNASNVKVSVPATGVTVGKDSLTLKKGDTETIKAAVSPSDSDSTVSWSSSDTSVATVAEDGTVTAVGAGTATITVKAGAYTASCEVTVLVSLESIEIIGTADTVKKGQTTQLEVKYNPADTTDNKEVSWSSSDTGVATVSGDGVVTGLKEGTVTITAAVGEKTDTYQINVKEIKITGIEVQDTLTLLKGETESLTATCTPADTTDDKTVTWTSSNPSVASVNETTGMVTALKEGTAEITATTKTLDGTTAQPFTAVTTVTVKENHLTDELAETLAFDEIDALLKGQELNLNSILNLQDILNANKITDDVTVNWTSSNEEAAVIDENGILKALEAGEVTVTAEVEVTNGAGEVKTYEAATVLEVTEIPLDSIAFDKVIKEMQVGTTETLKIICNPENTTDDKTVEWSSSNPSVITVDNGKLTAKEAGTAVITAKVGDKSVSCRIIVKKAEEQKPSDKTDGNTGNGGAANNGSTTDNGNAVSGSNANAGGAANSENTTSTNNKAKTGDNTNVMFFVILMIGAAAVITVFAKKKFYRVKR